MVSRIAVVLLLSLVLPAVACPQSMTGSVNDARKWVVQITTTPAVVTLNPSGGPGNSRDFVGVWAAGGANYLQWKYLNDTQTRPKVGLTSGTVTFSGLAPGNYEARFCRNGVPTDVIARMAFTVAPLVDRTVNFLPQPAMTVQPIRKLSNTNETVNITMSDDRKTAVVTADYGTAVQIGGIPIDGKTSSSGAATTTVQVNALIP